MTQSLTVYFTNTLHRNIKIQYKTHRITLAKVNSKIGQIIKE